MLSLGALAAASDTCAVTTRGGDGGGGAGGGGSGGGGGGGGGGGAGGAEAVSRRASFADSISSEEMEIPSLGSAQIQSRPSPQSRQAPPATGRAPAGAAGPGPGAGAAGREEARLGPSGADNQRHSLGSSLDGSSEFGESTDVLNLL